MSDYIQQQGLFYRNIGNSLIEVSYSQPCLRYNHKSDQTNKLYLWGSSDKIEIKFPTVTWARWYCHEGGVRGDQPTDCELSLTTWFTDYSLLPSCLRATHKASKTACDWPVITRSYYLLSWGPCHRRKNTLSSWASHYLTEGTECNLHQ